MDVQRQPINGILTSVLLIGSPMTTGKWDYDLLFLNWISNAKRLMESEPPFC